ncbi:organic solvent ABC transporter permease [Marinobacter fonticola]|uniref:organic solvent ABC transporter permease n=1 Tax=Marinobacter fonticola TaxID=2603215 RepID=UPI0011E795B8|nr:organic solvent ABC transporter permease [Marinobacter fonticola]
MRLKPLVLISSLALLQGCFGGDGDDGDDTLTGQLTLTGVEGLDYRTQSQTGETDSAGRFRYYPGETISFSIGNLEIASGVPTDKVITPLQFLPESRAALQSAIADEQGLLSHKPVERQVIGLPALINLTRLLLTLDDNQSTSDGDGVTVTDRVISQLNEQLNTLDAEIDFSQPVGTFALADIPENSEDAPEYSAVNRLLREICFYPEDDELCQQPPTQAEIDAAPELGDGEERDPDIDYTQDLENKRDRILDAIRDVNDIDLEDVEEYLLRELDRITTDRANDYYLSTVTANIPATDTDIREVFIKKIGGKPDVLQIEAKSTDPSAVVIHSASAQTHSVEYFIDGAPGDESDLIVNFRPAGDYRWLRKPLRVIIE